MIRKIINVEDQDPGGPGKYWYIRHCDTEDESHILGHYVSKQSFAACSAEYNIPLEDIDTLMDLVLHRHKDTVNHNHPHFVFNQDADSARELLKARISEIKKGYQITDPDNLLQAIRDHHTDNKYEDAHADAADRAHRIRNHK